MTEGSLYSLFLKALGSRTPTPTLEDCRQLLNLCGRGPIGAIKTRDWGLSQNVKASSITFRNKCTEARSYWENICGPDSDVFQTQVKPKFDALFLALEAVTPLLEPPVVFNDHWHDQARKFKVVFNLGMRRAGCAINFGIWLESPTVVFIKEGMTELGWHMVTSEAVVKYLNRKGLVETNNPE